jgi:hypothetical protein
VSDVTEHKVAPSLLRRGVSVSPAKYIRAQLVTGIS